MKLAYSRNTAAPELLTFKNVWRYRYVSREDIVEEDVTTTFMDSEYLSVDGYDQNYDGFAYSETDLFGENDVRT